MDKVTFEEINLLCIFDTGTRTGLIAEMEESLPHVDEPELWEMMTALIGRLKAMSDEDYNHLTFYPEYEEERKA